MPEYIALKTFGGRYGPVNRGETHTFEESYGRELLSLNLVRERELRPSRTVHHESAPMTAKKADGPNASADVSADGPAKPLSVSRPARRSRKRTPPTSNSGPGLS